MDDEEKNLMMGWQCPVCGVVYGPYMTQCPNFHGQTFTTSGAYTATATLGPGELTIDYPCAITFVQEAYPDELEELRALVRDLGMSNSCIDDDRKASEFLIFRNKARNLVDKKAKAVDPDGWSGGKK
jgi:hypothetical protein